jgi:hypothetical protein
MRERGKHPLPRPLSHKWERGVPQQPHPNG